MGSATDVTKSDTPTDKFNWVLCTTVGTILIEQEGGNVVTFAAPPTNVWIPCGKGTNIKIASTAAGMMTV